MPKQSTNTNLESLPLKMINTEENENHASLSSVSGTCSSDRTLYTTTNTSLIIQSPILKKSHKLEPLNLRSIEAYSNSKSLSLNSSNIKAEISLLSKKHEFKWGNDIFTDQRIVSPFENDALNNIFESTSYLELLNDNSIKDLPDIEYLKQLTLQRPDSILSFSNFDFTKNEDSKSKSSKVFFPSDDINS